MSRDLNTLLGTTLAGRFELRTLLGQGGFGGVFEAEQLSMGRRCAVKVLAPRDGVDRKNTARFEMEARATSKLSHPNTITIFDYGEDVEVGVFFIAMEFVEGQDLATLLKSGPLEVNDALHILAQAAGSLDNAHSHGIIHRDVKPQNIMICPRTGDGLYLKMIDFGIAKALGQGDLTPNTALTITGTIVGTPQYMSPEQVRDITLDGRSDQYSLAICAYTMLCGRPPFLGTSPIDIATKHLTDTPLPVSVLQPTLDVNPQFDDALLKALSKKPEDRYSTCVEFVEALKAQANDSAEIRGEMLTQQAGAFHPELTTEPMSEDLQPETVQAKPLVDLPDTEPAAPIASALPDEPGHTRALPVSAGLVVKIPAMVEAPRSTPAGKKWGVLVAGLFVVLGLSAVFYGIQNQPAPEAVNTVVVAPEVVSVVEQPTTQDSIEPAAVVDNVIGPAPTENVQLTHDDSVLDVVDAAKSMTTLVKQPEPVEVEAPDLEEVQVSVTIRPWGTLYIDGRPQGQLSRQVIRLSEGRHVFELRQDDKTKVRKVLDVTSRQNTTVNLVADH